MKLKFIIFIFLISIFICNMQTVGHEENSVRSCSVNSEICELKKARKSETMTHNLVVNVYPQSTSPDNSSIKVSNEFIWDIMPKKLMTDIIIINFDNYSFIPKIDSIKASISATVVYEDGGKEQIVDNYYFYDKNIKIDEREIVFYANLNPYNDTELYERNGLLAKRTSKTYTNLKITIDFELLYKDKVSIKESELYTTILSSHYYHLNEQIPDIYGIPPYFTGKEKIDLPSYNYIQIFFNR